MLAQAATAAPTPDFAFSINSSQIPGGIFPGSLSADDAGNIYVSSVSNIVKLAPNGANLGRWGASGSGAGQFGYPGPTVVDHQNNLYVADSANDRIEKFDHTGKFLALWGSSGTARGQFDFPDGIAIDNAGQVYIADAFNNRIQVFNSNGLFLRQFGSAGTNAGQFGNPGVITIDSSNHLYVIDVPAVGYDNFRVQKFSLDGTFESQWRAFGKNTRQTIEVAGITTDPANNVYVVDGANDVVQKFSNDGTFLAEWGSTGGAPGQFQTPMGIAIDPSGNYVSVADFYNARLNVFAYAARAPILYKSPDNQTIPAGATLTLNAGVFGAEPLSYQWKFNGVVIPNATNALLTIPNAQLEASGLYELSVTNTLGVASASNVLVSVLPLVISTLPPIGITATGATLAGNAVSGASPSSLWFEWGLDTNYSNTIGPILLAANTNVNLAEALTNLDGALTYHYRLTGSNNLGVVHGEDVQFEVGLAPLAITLPITVLGSNSVLLNAMVNPNARETTAFFRWGFNNSYGHTTPLMDLGNGTSLKLAQSQLNGLQPGFLYHAQVLVSNELGLVHGPDFTFIAPPWSLLPTPAPVWTSLAASADGSILAAVASGDHTYVSTNSGRAWMTNNSPAIAWQALTISADGSKMAAVAYGGPSGESGPAYYSTNYGAFWNKSENRNYNWVALASSGDGVKVAGADAADGIILTSTNAGRSWRTNSPDFSAPWNAIASSADGQKLVAAAGGLNNSTSGPLYTSSDGGLSWASNNLPNQHWRAVASSADGRILYAAVGGNHAGPIYSTTNAGAAWNLTGAPVTNWQAITCSADGLRLAAVLGQGNAVLISTNSGFSWQTQTLIMSGWSAIVSSVDGGRLFASGDRNIFTLQTSLPPQMEIRSRNSQLTLSWLIPSTSFNLQGAPGLFPSQWENTNVSPDLNFTNLHYEMTIPESNPAAFYRLITP